MAQFEVGDEVLLGDSVSERNRGRIVATEWNEAEGRFAYWVHFPRFGYTTRSAGDLRLLPLEWKEGRVYVRKDGLQQEKLKAVYVHPSGAALLVVHQDKLLRYLYAGPGDRDAYIEEKA